MKNKKIYIGVVSILVVFIIICIPTVLTKSKEKQKLNTNGISVDDIASKNELNGYINSTENFINEKNISSQQIENKVETSINTEEKKDISVGETNNKKTKTNTTVTKEQSSTKDKNTPTQQTNAEEQKEETKKEETQKVDLSKYDYYEKGLNGTYKGFIKDTQEIKKLKSLINTCIKENGYEDVKVESKEDKSLAKSGRRYFTANKTNVNNAISNCDGFTISYYAVKEYHISADGKETFFQTRSYIKVK